ncbi:MAG TPA: hypothetical protein PLA16_08445 [Chitinophagales bacterium]|jgi:DNA repair exonuclease SbcCD ATPase subunit|nr:hypothetical protein [Chitinophagales bacterium]HQO31953.1 hypothetical protein [Chitinophagales bacterium]HQO90514.1 hypothetical protein [Chitinophagales bacterium]
MSQSENTSNSKVHAMYIVLIALLIGGLVYTNVKLKKSKETIVVTEKQRDDVTALKAELDKKYGESLQEIESYRAENAGLDSLLSVRTQELTAKKAKIDALLSQISTLQSNDAAKSKLLAEAQALIKQMDEDKARLQTSIDSLMTVNKQLYQERDSVTGELVNTLAKKQEIEDENKKMKDRIDKASILSTANIQATPIRMTKKGKEDEVSKAKDAEKLRVCFDLLQNKIAPSGQTELAVRIVSPDGTTIQMSSLGSGTLQDATTGNDIPFTYTISPDYQNETKTVCSYWAQTFKFSPGKYSVEVYEKGFLIGQSSFMMK